VTDIPNTELIINILEYLLYSSKQAITIVPIFIPSTHTVITKIRNNKRNGETIANILVNKHLHIFLHKLSQ
jgi:hypothetical protein